MTRRQCIGALAFAPFLRAVQSYNSIEEALAHRDDALSLILNRTQPGDDIGRLPKLRNLILNNNDLDRLPRGIEQLRELRAIFLGGSPRLDFRAVIDVLASLPQLEGVGLDNNRMRAVPENIGKLKTCKRLGLSSNELTSLPDSICKLESLESLDIYNNQLTALPACFGAFKKLRRIYILESGLSKDSFAGQFPGVDLSESVPPEVYLQLK